jgi:enoyl-CoA hydratase
MLSTGARFDARRAYEMGFLQELVPQGAALPRALELAEVIASYPNFPGICADRRAVLRGLSLDLDAGLLLEAEIVRPACVSDEMRAGLGRFADGARDASPRPPRL